MSRKYVNTTHYNTAPHDDKHPFLVISNEIIKDQRLSDEELGLMIRILNNSESYVFNSSYFQAHVSSLGERRYYKSLKHLQELGYIIKKPKQGGIDWIINEVPSNVITDKPKDANNNGSRLEDGVSTVPEVTNCDITTGKSTNREITNGETEVLTNNNETIINENIIKEISKNEITNNQIINNTNIEENTLLNNQDEVIEIDKEFERIFNFDDSVFSKLNIDNTGNDVIDKTGIDNYINKIKRTLNSEKFEELSNIFNEIGQLIIDKLDYKSFEKLFERKFGLLPQFFITKNNIKLSQLYLNLEDFIQDYEIKLKENKMNSTAQTTASKVHSKELKSKKVEVQENTNTTKVISIKSRTEINKLPTSG
ncbi:MAG: hypothetical protein JXR48_10045, partial [Candidatus Delongbacteria bacterium]|nr:hypothetical protein [Candidatus Delongbacteria bacterium]